MEWTFTRMPDLPFVVERLCQENHDREADIERGCSRVQRQPKNRRQVVEPLPLPGLARLARSFFATTP